MKFLTPVLLASAVAAHFKITSPGSIGFNDDQEGTSPCGGFDVTSRTNVTDYPSGGLTFVLLTTHASAIWNFKAALLDNTDDFQYLSAPISQTGLGTICIENIAGPTSWAGKDGVVQVTQGASDGDLYQCVAVKFTDGSAADLPSSCSNSTGVSATWGSLPSDAVLAGSNSTSNSTSTSTSTTSASSSSATGAAGHIVASVGSAALMAAAAYVL